MFSPFFVLPFLNYMFFLIVLRLKWFQHIQYCHGFLFQYFRFSYSLPFYLNIPSFFLLTVYINHFQSPLSSSLKDTDETLHSFRMQRVTLRVTWDFLTFNHYPAVESGKVYITWGHFLNHSTWINIKLGLEIVSFS